MLLSRKFVKAAAGVGLATVTCKTLAALQQLLLARTLGATEMADAFFLAQVLPVLLSGLLYNSISANVVVLLASLPPDDEKGALLSGLLCQVIITMAFLASVIACLSFAYVQVMHTAIDQRLATAAVGLQLVLLPLMLLQPVSGVLAGALQGAGRVVAPPVAMIFPYLLGIAGLSLTGDGSPYPLAWGLIAGSVLQVLALAWALRKAGTTLRRPAFGNGVRLLKSALPGLGCNAISTLYLVSDRAFAATVGGGQVAAISYVYSIITMPTQILVNTLVAASLPRWVTLSANAKGFADSVSQAAAILSLAIVPIALVLGLASEPLTDLLLGSSSFSASRRAEIGRLLSTFCVATLCFALKDLFTAALVAQGKPGFAFGIGSASLLFACMVRWIASDYLGLEAVALATTLGLLACVLAMTHSIARAAEPGTLWRHLRLGVLPAVPALVLGMTLPTMEVRTFTALTAYAVCAFWLLRGNVTIQNLLRNSRA
jgi:putative peptidoglycan lipid II flippase